MRTLVVLISHLFNDMIVDRYKDLERSLLDNQELILAHPVEHTESFFIKNNINHLACVPAKNYIDEKNWRLLDNTGLFLDIYERKPGFDYYWLIEYDVTINTRKSDKFREIFEYFDELKADVVCDHVNSYTTNHYYNARYSWNALNDWYPAIKELGLTKKDIHFGFYPICRLSKKFLEEYKNSPEYQTIYFEIGITTMAYMKDMCIHSFINKFSTVDDLTQDKWQNMMNIGSNSWQRKEYKSYYQYPEGCIIHPVKSYD